MGILDQVIGSVLSGASSQERGTTSSPIADALTELLAPNRRTQGRGAAGGGLGDIIGGLSGAATSQPADGLGGLLDSLTRSGHGEIADSWVNTGQNMPVAPHQLEQALDRDTIEDLSRRTGLSRDELLRQLSQHLPNAVDRLTPDGQRPTQETMGHW